MKIRTRRKLQISVSLLLAFTFLSACSPDQTIVPQHSQDDSSSSSVSSEAASSGESASVSEETSVSSKAGDDDSDVDKVVLYTPHDADPMNAAVNTFMAHYPDIQVEVVAAGTGELLDKIAAESADPKADVLWGGGADSLAAYKDYFESYVSVNDEKIDPQFKDSDHKWTGESPLPMVIIYNKKLLKEAGLSAPESWADCLRPEFKGQIAYCMPSKSGSAYTQLCTMIQANGGKEAGWDYVEKFVANLNGKILDSSSKCHKLVANGEYMIGITIEKSAITYSDNDDIGFCYPSEGTSAVPDAISIVKNCPDEENARIFTDYVTSVLCQQEQCSDWNRRPSRSDVSDPEGLASISDISLIDYDFQWAADNKASIIDRFNDLMGIQ